MKIYSFPPIEANNPKVLILGTMPSVKSLALKQYYGHPQNSFWKLMFEIFSQPYLDNYSVKTQLLIDNKICLWDVLQVCEREGSLDSNISKEIENDIKGLLSRNKQVSTVCFNGKSAEKYFQKYIGNIETVNQIILPSTSPANTRLTYRDKLKEWTIIKKIVS